MKSSTGPKRSFEAELEKKMKNQPRPDLTNQFLLQGFVLTLLAVFRAAWLMDPRFRKAVRSFRATYVFHSGDAAGQLVFKPGGRFHFSPRPASGREDYRVDFLDLPAAVERMAEDPNDVIRLLLENRVDASGNVYYLFHFGYLCELCRPYFRLVRPVGKAAAEFCRAL